MMENVLSWAVWVVPVVLAILLHEIAHGYTALYFGDTTAKDNRRLSLNPLRHVDAFGTIIFPVLLKLSGAPFVFGWAKPVPVDFSRLRNPKKDMVWVALAGPAVNLALAVAAFAVLSFYKNVLALMPSDWTMQFLINMILFNFSILVFNLIPILPMDGGRILTGLLPLPLAIRYARTERYGFVVLVSLLILLPVLGDHMGWNLDFISAFLAYAVKGLISFFAGVFGMTDEGAGMSIGFFQLLIILLIILVLFGRGRLSALAEDLGKSVSSFKRGLKEGEEDKKSPADETEEKSDNSKAE